MIITNVNDGPKANYGLNGTNMTISVANVGDLTVDLQAKQSDVQKNVDISLDRSFSRLVEGAGAWYVASIEIPPVSKELYDTGEVDENGDPIMAQRELPLDTTKLDTTKVKLRLWGLPENISKEVTE